MNRHHCQNVECFIHLPVVKAKDIRWFEVICRVALSSADEPSFKLNSYEEAAVEGCVASLSCKI